MILSKIINTIRLGDSEIYKSKMTKLIQNIHRTWMRERKYLVTPKIINSELIMTFHTRRKGHWHRQG